MEKYKNINSIEEVKKVLGDFQELYKNKDIKRVDNYVDEEFSSREGLAVLGSSMGQWCFNTEDIKTLIKSHFASENNYWKDINFKFQEAKIFADENVAWVVSIGVIKNTITEDEYIENTIKKVKELLDREDRSKVDALKAASQMANTLRQIEKGENYIWPVRFTCVLIKENQTWKFHQMQFSFDSETWPDRLDDETYIKSIFEMTEVNSKAKYEEVRNTLQILQDGYIKRDVSFVDELLNQIGSIGETLSLM